MVVMKNALVKDTLREIKKSLGRFISIFAIITLGVAFFTGIKASAPDMRLSADKYYDNQNFMDFTVLSTLGLTKEDIEVLKLMPQVQGVFPSHSMDVITKLNNGELVLKVLSLPTDNLNSQKEDFINRPILIEGRLPGKFNECVVEKGKFSETALPIGSKIKIESGSDKDIKEELENYEYTVVGYVQSPIYLSHEKGSSNIGSGKVNNIMLIPEENFKQDIYTEAYLTVKNARSEFTYGDKYWNLLKPVVKEIEDIGEKRSKLRYDEVIDEANKKLSSSKQEYIEKKVEAESELKRAAEKIEKAKSDADNGEIAFKNKEKEFHLTINAAKAEIKNGEQQLLKGEEEYAKNLKEFNEKKPLIETQLKQGEEAIKNGEEYIVKLQGYIDVLKSSLQNPNITAEEKIKIETEIKEKDQGLVVAQDSLEKSKQQLQINKIAFAEGEEKLKIVRSTLDSSKIKLEQEKEKLDSGIKTAEKEFKESRDALEQGKIDIKTGEEKYNKSKKEAEEQFEDAERKIVKAENDIKNTSEPKWYVLDREKNYSYMDYKGAADRVNAIAQVFPVFFFLVAALVCLTTMTRMVDEQRVNMGTLKALGYSKGAIASKYIIYAAVASLAGSMLGLAIGFTVFPIVIFNAYGIMYNVPEGVINFNVPYAVIGTSVAVLTTTMAAIFACYKELVETPSLLMRPKAPKNGKRILLERVNFLWKRFSFIEKVTARNIFRYKKRFLMTVLGISGCTALLVAGFGIKDSIEIIVDKQFGEIFKYDMTIGIDRKATTVEQENIEKYLSDNEEISNHMYVQTLNYKIIKGNSEKEISLVVPKGEDKFKEFITLKNRKSKEEIPLPKDGAVITEKLATGLDIKVGDTITLTNDDKEDMKLEVKGISENYVNHYIYISNKCFEKNLGYKPEFNEIITKLSNPSIEKEANMSMEIIKIPKVKSVNFNTGVKDNFHNMISSLNYVILVMIVSAGALAFVVLYNLTNVNISERLREIATIKVLGFYDKEVSAYVYRENIILTIIGILTGLLLGVFLHKFIIVTSEMEAFMFGRSLDVTSFMYSSMLTFLFAILVNTSMYYKLKNIPMVESLKSVD